MDQYIIKIMVIYYYLYFWSNKYSLDEQKKLP